MRHDAADTRRRLFARYAASAMPPRSASLVVLFIDAGREHVDASATYAAMMPPDADARCYTLILCADAYARYRLPMPPRADDDDYDDIDGCHYVDAQLFERPRRADDAARSGPAARRVDR